MEEVRRPLAQLPSVRDGLRCRLRLLECGMPGQRQLVRQPRALFALVGRKLSVGGDPTSGAILELIEQT